MVSASRAKEFAIPEDMSHIEVSSVSGHNINVAFYMLAAGTHTPGQFYFSPLVKHCEQKRRTHQQSQVVENDLSRGNADLSQIMHNY